MIVVCRRGVKGPDTKIAAVPMSSCLRIGRRRTKSHPKWAQNRFHRMRLPCSASSRRAGCAEDGAPAYSHHRARGIRKIEEALHKKTTGSMVTVTEIHTRKTQPCGADLSSKHHMSPNKCKDLCRTRFTFPDPPRHRVLVQDLCMTIMTSLLCMARRHGAI